MATIHSQSHVTKINFKRSSELMCAFANEALRGVQLEYVFSKFVSEEAGDSGKLLRDDKQFMEGLTAIKEKYIGNESENLSLCHGDFHPGSIMANMETGRVIAIDPEFAIYGPPGVDIGSLLSGIILAAVHHSVDGAIDGVRSLQLFCETLLESYALNKNNLTADQVDKIFEDALGFAACEVARTALGFAGGRVWLKYENDSEKSARALTKAVGAAKTLMVDRSGKLVTLRQVFGDL